MDKIGSIKACNESGKQYNRYMERVKENRIEIVGKLKRSDNGGCSMNRIIIESKRAIRKGLGNYYVMPNLTWYDLLEGYEAGNIIKGQI